MESHYTTTKFIALLQGINVGGHHKVPMVQLKQVLEEMGLKNVQTLLNSGNVIFEAENNNVQKLEEHIEKQLRESFGFSIPVIITSADLMRDLFQLQPFKEVKVVKDTQLYVSFLKNKPVREPELPWASSDNSFNILTKLDKMVLSILDTSSTKTTDAMKILENFYGKDITTRNFNTIERILKKL